MPQTQARRLAARRWAGAGASTSDLPRVRSAFRYSNRADMGVTDAMRAAEAVRGVVGKRLTYDQPRQAA